MTPEEVCAKYRVCPEKLQACIAKGLISAEPTEKEIQLLSCILFLKQNGLCEECLQKFCSGTDAEKLCVLRSERARMLEELHICQKNLDCIDNVIYDLAGKCGL